MNNIIESIQNWMEHSIVDEIILIAILIALVESFAQNTIKASEHSSLLFIFGLIIYSIVGYLLHYAYHKFPLGKINVIWSCISILLAIGAGYFIYDEHIDSWAILAAICAISAVYCYNKSTSD
jgi:multidrug transporter EmrE-like cation transporter